MEEVMDMMDMMDMMTADLHESGSTVVVESRIEGLVLRVDFETLGVDRVGLFVFSGTEGIVSVLLPRLVSVGSLSRDSVISSSSASHGS